MQRTSWAWVTLVLLLGLVAWHVGHYSPLLPEWVASNFDGGGHANGYTGKASFLRLYVVLVVGLAGIFVASALVMPRLPTSLVNVPHKDYYLAPERRAATLGYFQGFLLWFGNATVLFIVATMHLTFEANLVPEPRLGGMFFVLLGAYAVGCVVATVVVLQRFRRPRPGVGKEDVAS